MHEGEKKLDLQRVLGKYLTREIAGPAFGCSIGQRRGEVIISPDSRYVLDEFDEGGPDPLVRYTLSHISKAGYKSVVYENNRLIRVSGFGEDISDQRKHQIAKQMFHGFVRAAKRVG